MFIIASKLNGLLEATGAEEQTTANRIAPSAPHRMIALYAGGDCELKLLSLQQRFANAVRHTHSPFERNRKLEAEGSTLPDHAIHLDGILVFLYNSVTDRQPKASAL